MTLIAVCLVLALFAGCLYALWLDHEEQKAAKLARMRKIAQACSEAKPWPYKGPKGFSGDVRHRKVS